MAKYSGYIGYALTQETEPGVWSESITEKRCYGDIIKDNRKIVDSNQINNSINISNTFSILSNKFMLSNLSNMRYITFMKSKWNISSVEVKPPRMILTIGGLYNE